MVSIHWANADVLSLPELGVYAGQEDFEALLALSHFTRTFSVDASGTLNWPFPVARSLDYSGSAAPMDAAQVMDARAQHIWADHPTVAVLCAGDVDSVAVLAALVKHAPDLTNLVVRHTEAGRLRYPNLFSNILPALGVTLESRDGQPLVGDSTLPYCDGRSGDDWQAGYQGSTLGPLRELMDSGTLSEAMDAMLTPLQWENATRREAARRGLQRFADNAPFPVTTPWALMVAAYRLCATQYDVFNGPITEDDPENATSARVAFFDHPSFTAASAWIAQSGVMPSPDNESLALREYAFSVFNDVEWANAARPSSVYYLYRLGKFNTHWLGEGGRPYFNSDLPLPGMGSRPAEWHEIRDWRDAHETAPVATTLGVFDCDERSDARMARAIEQFDQLPTVQAGRLAWKRADNTKVALTKAELVQAYDEIKTGIAIRSATLHVKAERFRQMDPAPTPAQLSDLSFWLED